MVPLLSLSLLVGLGCLGPDLEPEPEPSSPFGDDTATTDGGDGGDGGDGSDGSDGGGDTGLTACASASLATVRTFSPDPAVPVDQCDEVCFSIEVTCEGAPLVDAEAALEVEGLGFVAEGRTDTGGVLSGCITGLPAGVSRVAATVRVAGEKARAYSTVDARPFGYKYGLDKPVEALTVVELIPTLSRSAENPVLEAGEADTWDQAGVLLPSVARAGADWVLYYAGSPDVDYEVGGARSPDGLSWTKLGAAPVLPADLGVEGSWKQYATNSPFVLYEGGVYSVWYTGRSTDTGSLDIGLATSSDGRTFTDAAENPVFSPELANLEWEGDGVAHPALVHRDGVYELFYSTGKHYIGYALSTDGKAWERYCMGPVMGGHDLDWEQGQVKSAEVIWTGDAYYMSYSGGQTGAFQLGWAESTDGIRWVKSDLPLLSPELTLPWEAKSVLGSAMVLEGDTLRLWYSGTSTTTSAIGYAEAAFAP
jgi:predicted GH43/DUF377 family glycosyl hydrolase